MSASHAQWAMALRRALSGKGLRFTRQRACVLDVLSRTSEHPTAEEVYRDVRKLMPSVSLATVYQSLDTLVLCGLAQKLTFGNSSARYDHRVQEHPHMRDLQTGRVTDVPFDVVPRLGLSLSADVRQEIENLTGFKVEGLRVELLVSPSIPPL